MKSDHLALIMASVCVAMRKNNNNDVEPPDVPSVCPTVGARVLPTQGSQLAEKEAPTSMTRTIERGKEKERERDPSEQFVGKVKRRVEKRRPHRKISVRYKSVSKERRL